MKKQNWPWYILGLIILGALLIYTFNLERPQVVQSDLKNSAELAIFKNTRYDFSVSYPKDWPVEDKELDYIILGEAPETIGPGFVTIASIEGRSLSDFPEVTDQYSNCPVDEVIDLNGLSARHVVCVEEEANQNIHGYFIEENADLYTLSYIESRSENKRNTKLNQDMADIVFSFTLEE